MKPEEIKRATQMTMEVKQNVFEIRNVLDTWMLNDTEIYPPELEAVQSKIENIDMLMDGIFAIINDVKWQTPK